MNMEEEDSKQIWSMYPEDKWKCCPLGSLPDDNPCHLEWPASLVLDLNR